MCSFLCLLMFLYSWSQFPGRGPKISAGQIYEMRILLEFHIFPSDFPTFSHMSCVFISYLYFPEHASFHLRVPPVPYKFCHQSRSCEFLSEASDSLGSRRSTCDSLPRLGPGAYVILASFSSKSVFTQW